MVKDAYFSLAKKLKKKHSHYLNHYSPSLPALYDACQQRPLNTQHPDVRLKGFPSLFSSFFPEESLPPWFTEKVKSTGHRKF